MIPVDEFVQEAEQRIAREQGAPAAARTARQLRFLLWRRQPGSMAEAQALLDALIREDDRP
jgi:hypothetical protein